jgi:hypothetical protein
MVDFGLCEVLSERNVPMRPIFLTYAEVREDVFAEELCMYVCVTCTEYVCMVLLTYIRTCVCVCVCLCVVSLPALSMYVWLYSHT